MIKITSKTSKSFPDYLLLILLMIASATSNGVLADTWASPSIREYLSDNGRYAVITKPGSRDRPPVATVYLIDNDNRIILWQSSLTNRTAPITSFVSNDGQYVITLDNWSRIGYGEDVIAFYNRTGQIKRYSFEEATSEFFSGKERPRFWKYFTHTASSRCWRSNSIIRIDGTGRSASFGIWLHWAGRWFVWRLHDGMPVKLVPGVKREWDEIGREWSIEQLKDDRNVAACCLFLAYLKDPRDRNLIEQRLDSKDYNISGTVYSPIRRAADRALAFWDDLVDDLTFGDAEYFFLGKVHISVQLPQAPKKDDSQLVVLIYSAEKQPGKWDTSKTDYKLSKSFKYWREGNVNREITFRLHGITPGKYWIKIIWDKTPPYKHSLFFVDRARAWRRIDLPDITLAPGDFESVGVEHFAVKAGQTAEVTVGYMAPY